MKQIRCESCLGKWLVADEDLDRQRVCPYCASSIHGEVEFSEYDSLDKAIYGAITKMGKGVIQNPRQLSGFMLDMAPMLKKEIRIFSKTVTDDYVVHIKSAFDAEVDSLDSVINKLHHLFVEEEGLSESWADMLCTGLYGAILYSKGVGTTRIIHAEVCDYIVSEDKSINPSTAEQPHKNKVENPIAHPATKDTESADDEQYDILNHYKCSICGYVVDGYDLEYGDNGKNCPICGAERWVETEDELSGDASISVPQQKTPSTKKSSTNSSIKHNSSHTQSTVKTYNSAPYKSIIESANRHMANRETEQALEDYRQMANAGYVPAYISIADIYYQRKNYKKSWKWYLKAAEAEDSTGQYYVGYFYQEGLHVTKNTHLAMKYYEKAAEQGLIAAIMAIAYCYQTGIGYKKDMVKAMENYTKAANAGNADAQYKLGILFQTGDGVNKDITLAAEWFQKAAAQGHSEAKKKLEECISLMPITQRIKWKFH